MNRSKFLIKVLKIKVSFHLCFLIDRLIIIISTQGFFSQRRSCDYERQSRDRDPAREKTKLKLTEIPVSFSEARRKMHQSFILSEGHEERIISQQILLYSGVIDAVFFLSRHAIIDILGVERLYRFIDVRTVCQKQVSVPRSRLHKKQGGWQNGKVKGKAGCRWRSLCSTRGCQISHAVTRKIPVKF